MLYPLICGRQDDLMASTKCGGSLDEVFGELEEDSAFAYSGEVARARGHFDEAGVSNVPVFPGVCFALVHKLVSSRCEGGQGGELFRTRVEVWVGPEYVS